MNTQDNVLCMVNKDTNLLLDVPLYKMVDSVLFMILQVSMSVYKSRGN